MPRLVESPVNVVETKDVSISEFFGGASANPCNGAISVAHVKAKAGWAEDWQTPQFDEYVLVLKGVVAIEHDHGKTVECRAGQAVFLAKGERVRWVFKEEAEYVPICLPAFSPANVFREDVAAGDSAPAHTKHTTIYHLVQKHLWEACKAEGKTYYPPSYDQDGFTHATADPKYLIGVANHFYRDVKADWLCLKMTRETLSNANITLKFEDPSPVGTTSALTTEQSGGEKFPHIYGGIPADGSVVLQESVVRRAEDGTYLSIDGLC